MAPGSVRTAQEGANAGSSVLSGFASDLFVLRGSVRSRRKKGTPVNWEIHANPLGFGAAAVGAGLTLWLMQLRLYPNKYPSPAWTEQKYHPEIPHYESKHYDGYWEYRQGPAYWDELEKKWQQDELPPIWHEPYDEWTSKAPWTETIEHPAGETEIKKFSIEQRQGFQPGFGGVFPSMPDILGNTAQMAGLAALGWIPLIGTILFGKK